METAVNQHGNQSSKRTLLKTSATTVDARGSLVTPAFHAPDVRVVTWDEHVTYLGHNESPSANITKDLIGSPLTIGGWTGIPGRLTPGWRQNNGTYGDKSRILQRYQLIYRCPGGNVCSIIVGANIFRSKGNRSTNYK